MVVVSRVIELYCPVGPLHSGRVLCVRCSRHLCLEHSVELEQGQLCIPCRDMRNLERRLEDIWCPEPWLAPKRESEQRVRMKAMDLFYESAMFNRPDLDALRQEVEALEKAMNRYEDG